MWCTVPWMSVILICWNIFRANYFFLLAMVYLESNKAAVILFCSAGNNDIPDLQRAGKECYDSLVCLFFPPFFFFFCAKYTGWGYIYIYTNKYIFFLFFFIINDQLLLWLWSVQSWIFKVLCFLLLFWHGLQQFSSQCIAKLLLCYCASKTEHAT